MNDASLPAETARFKETSRTSEILEIASRLFYENGFSNVGMRMIADEVGVSAATLYHHFKSKDDMLFQITLGVTQTFVELLLPILQETPAPQDRRERLKSFIREHIKWRWRRRYWVSTALRDMHNLSLVQQEEVTAYLRHYQDTLRDFIQEGMQEAVFQAPSATLAGFAVIGMIHGINEWFQPGGSLSINRVATIYADMAVDDLLGAGRAG